MPVSRSMAAISIYLMTACAAHATGCKLNGVNLDCGAGGNEAVMQAFADRETAEILQQPLLYLERFERPSDMEAFRKSLETVWRKSNRAERSVRRKMLRRQMSAAQFEEWSQSYDAAMRNYASGITFYRTLVWHGKTGKTPPNDN